MILDKHDTIGIDAVAMCVNDIACAGGEPLFFLDYIACGKNYPEKIAEIVSGVAEGCVQSDAALIGGETAEHPGLMPEEDYDLAGFAVGVCDRKDLITGENLKDGDVLIGMASTGVHSNGVLCTEITGKFLFKTVGSRAFCNPTGFQGFYNFVDFRIGNVRYIIRDKIVPFLKITHESIASFSHKIWAYHITCNLDGSSLQIYCGRTATQEYFTPNMRFY